MFAVKLILFLIAVGFAIRIIVRNSMIVRDRETGAITFDFKRNPFVKVLVLIIGVLILNGAYGAVPTGHRGIVLRWSAATGRVLNQGIYFVWPIAERVDDMSVQVKAHLTKAAAASKDLQNVETSVTLNFAVLPDAAAILYRDVGVGYEQTIIVPAIQEAVKAATAGFDAERLIVDRPLVKEKISTLLTDRLKQHGIRVDAVSITDFQFSPEFTAAIEAKVTAVQNALRAENQLKQVEFEAKQRIAQAEGEAKAITIQAQAIQTQGGKSYIDLKWIEKWNGQLPNYLFGGSATPMFVMPAGK
jgi:regulator of protease activity HflC (stomatin/prohibitin superfamily)